MRTYLQSYPFKIENLAGRVIRLETALEIGLAVQKKKQPSISRPLYQLL